MKILSKAIALIISVGFIGISFNSIQVSATEIENKSSSNMEMNISINDENVVESERLTYDELINEVIKNENLSRDEAKKFLGIDNDSELRNGTYYRTYTYGVTVTSTYKPTVVFYCKTSEWGNNRGILSVINTSLNRSYNGMSKQFSGTLYTNLENSYTIYFELNGDFFNNGTTTVGGGVEIGIGETSNISFSISSASNHFKYLYKTGRFKLY